MLNGVIFSAYVNGWVGICTAIFVNEQGVAFSIIFASRQVFGDGDKAPVRGAAFAKANGF